MFHIPIMGLCIIILLILFTSIGLVVLLIPKAILLSRYILNIIFLLVISSFLLLVYVFITDSNEVALVIKSSSPILPILYKVGAIWSNPEGSIMLWMFVSAVAGLYVFNRYKLDTARNYFLLFYSGQYLNIIMFLFLTTQFFHLTDDVMAYSGLNPLLQDIALIIHPPILYLGYAFAFIVFILSFHSSDKKVIQPLLFSARSCLLFIAAGVSLGAWWAYRELGWGGYWYFDPVENISLLPLIFAISYYHNLIVNLNNKGTLTDLLGISIFTSFVVGTCFVRSGLIMSVHSFINESVQGYYYLIFAFSFVALTFSLYYILNMRNQKVITTTNVTPISVANFVWITLAGIILLTLLIPVISHIWYSETINFEYEFFLKIVVPLFLLVVFLMGISSENRLALSRALQIKIFFSITLSIIIWYGFFYHNLYSLLGLLASIFLILEISLAFIKALGQNQLEKKLPMLLSHFGVALLCLSITINKNFEQEYNITGKVGESITRDEFAFHIKGTRYSKSKNYLREIVDIEIENQETKEINILSPENRLYIIEKLINSEANIISFLFSDLYGVINNISSEEISVTIYYKPFISIIWVSCILIGIGVTVSFIKRSS